MNRRVRLLSSFIFVLMLISFVFSGCNIVGVFDGSIEGIMQPPIPDRDKYDIQLMLDSTTKGTITLKMPKEGRFVTAYTEYDLDNDQTNEMIVFYQEKIRDKDGDKITMYIHLFRKDDETGNWVSAESIKAEESDIYSLDFCDLNKDGVYEIVVMWDHSLIQTSKTLAVYEYKNKKLEFGDSKSCAVATTIDLILYNNTVEIVTFSIKSDTEEGSTSTAEVFVYKNRTLLPQDEALELDENIVGFAKVSPSSERYINGQKYYARVVVDSYYGNMQTLFTQFFYWKDGSLKVSYLDPEIEKRTSDITSRDINSDGVVEFPSIRPIKVIGEDSYPYCVVAWLSDSEIQKWPVVLWGDTIYTISIPDFDFILKIPNDWWWASNNIAIENDEENNMYIIYRVDDNGNVIRSYLSVRVFTIYDWENNQSEWEKDKDVLGNTLKYTKIKTNKAGTLVYALGSASGEIFEGIDLIVNE